LTQGDWIGQAFNAASDLWGRHTAGPRTFN